MRNHGPVGLPRRHRQWRRHDDVGDLHNSHRPTNLNDKPRLWVAALGIAGPTVDATVLADADAKTAGLNRSELIEQALRNKHLRRTLDRYTTHTVPALNINS
jgi:hypothetical protein